MLIEHRIRETIDAFTTRVRRDLDAHVRGLMSDLTRLLQDSQDGWRLETERAVTDAKVDAERAFRARVDVMRTEMMNDVEVRLTGERAELEAALASAKAELREEHTETFSRLLAAVRRLDEATSLSGILETLARGAAVEATRVAVFIVDGDMLRSWGHFGFGAGQGPADVPLAVGGILATTVGSRQSTFVSPAHDDRELPAFMRMPDDFVGLIVPIIVGGDVVGLLYADGPERRQDQERAASWPEQVELFVRHAALRLENITSVRTVEVLGKTR